MSVQLNTVQRDRLEAFIKDQRTIFDFEQLFLAALELQTQMAAAETDIAGLESGASAAVRVYKIENANQTKNTFNTVQTFTTGPVIAANELAVGDTFEIEWMCQYSANAGTTPTYTFAIKMGATTVRSFALVANIGVANAEFYLRQTFVVKAIGAGGSVECVGMRTLGTTGDAATLGTLLNSSPTLTALNTTATCTITSTVNCSALSINNTTTQRCLKITRTRS